MDVEPRAKRQGGMVKMESVARSRRVRDGRGAAEARRCWGGVPRPRTEQPRGRSRTRLLSHPHRTTSRAKETLDAEKVKECWTARWKQVLSVPAFEVVVRSGYSPSSSRPLSRAFFPNVMPTPIVCVTPFCYHYIPASAVLSLVLPSTFYTFNTLAIARCYLYYSSCLDLRFVSSRCSSCTRVCFTLALEFGNFTLVPQSLCAFAKQINQSAPANQGKRVLGAALPIAHHKMVRFFKKIFWKHSMRTKWPAMFFVHINRCDAMLVIQSCEPLSTR